MNVNLLLIQLRQPLLHGRIPVVLDGIIGSSLQVFCYLGPSVPQIFMRQEQQPFLAILPVVLLYVGVQVVVPPLSALLADPAWLKDSVPGRCSDMVVHFCAPYFWTSLMRYASSSEVHDFFLTRWAGGYICECHRGCYRWRARCS